MTADDDLKADIVEKLARKKVTGKSKRQVGTVKNWFASSDQGAVEECLRELARDPSSPVEMYGGGGRDNVRLTSLHDARDWLSDHKRDLWWL